MKRIWLTCMVLLGLPVTFSTPLAAPLPARGSSEVFFTPWDDAEGAIVRALGRARHSIHMQAYLITSKPISRALQNAHDRGLVVAILADQDQLRSQSRHGDTSQLDKLEGSGIDVRIETRYAAAHNKIILIDAASAHPVVITGSYNFSWSAQARNAENLLILRDHPALARRYFDNWQRHYADAQAWSKDPREP